MDWLQERIKVPLTLDDWLGNRVTEGVLLERAFGLPTNLDADQTVWLVIETSEFPVAQVSLNGHLLGSISVDEPTLRAQVGSLLQPRNRVQIKIDGSPSVAAAIRKVRLEID